MAKGSRSRPNQADLARRDKSHPEALGQTARSPGYRPAPLPSAFTLIRTVLAEPAPGFVSPPRRGKPRSPLVSVRATDRSSDYQAKRFTWNPTALHPELTQRSIHCARRGIRREVLFATRRTGKGAKAPRRRQSKTRC